MQETEQTQTATVVKPKTALIILCSLAFLNYLDRNLLLPLLGIIASDLGLSETELGALATGFLVVYALSAPVFGYLSDRMARRTVLLVSLLFWSAVTALSGTATGFATLLLWRSLTGLGEGGYFPTAISLIGDVFDRQRRGMAIAIHGVFATLGGSAGYALGGALGEGFGWRVPFFISVVPGLILAWVLYRKLIEPPRRTHTELADDEISEGESPAKQSFHTTVKVVLSPPVLMISLAASAGAYAMSGITTWFPRFLEEEQHLSATLAGSLTGLTFAATIIGQLSGGYISDRLAEKKIGARPLLAGISYAVAAPAIAVIALNPLLAAVLLCFALTQIGRGFAEPNLYGTIIDTVASDNRGSAQGFLLLLTFIGGAMAPVATGAIINAFDYRAAIMSLGYAAGVSAFFGLALWVYLKRRAPAPAESLA